VRVAIALAAGLLTIAVGVALTLARRPLVLVAENLPQTHHTLIMARHSAGACQAGEVLPAGTSAVRLGLTTDIGSRVGVKVLADSRVIAEGTQRPGWRGASVTVALPPRPRTLAPVTVCFALTDLNSAIRMLGLATGAHVAARAEGKALPGRMHVEYLRPGPRSWWSMLSSVSWRLGLGRAASGTWYALLLLTLVVALVVLSSWAVLRESR